MSASRVGALVGILCALGVLLSLYSLPVMRRPTLEQRVALGAGSARVGGPRWDRTSESFTALLKPLLTDIGARLRRGAGLFSIITGSDQGLASRLRAAGIPANESSIARHRMQQMGFAAAGLACAVAVAAASVMRGASLSVVPVLILSAAFVFSAVLAHDYRLTRVVRVRRERMTAELPATAELLALAIAAGEAPAAALARVGRASSGLLAREFEAAAEAARSGKSVVAVLKDVATAVQLAPLTRMVESVSISLDRGTPLGDVLRAQAADLRSEMSRTVMESAGRKEIAMLLPVVFLVMPTVVVVALFPGWQTLSLITR